MKTWQGELPNTPGCEQAFLLAMPKAPRAAAAGAAASGGVHTILATPSFTGIYAAMEGNLTTTAAAIEGLDNAMQTIFKRLLGAGSGVPGAGGAARSPAWPPACAPTAAPQDVAGDRPRRQPPALHRQRLRLRTTSRGWASSASRSPRVAGRRRRRLPRPALALRLRVEGRRQDARPRHAWCRRMISHDRERSPAQPSGRPGARPPLRPRPRPPPARPPARPRARHLRLCR